MYPDLADVEALECEAWGRLRALSFGGGQFRAARSTFDTYSARALTGPLRRMRALRELKLHDSVHFDAATALLFIASIAKAAPHLRALTLTSANLTPEAARALAETGWRLDELDLSSNPKLGPAGFAALLAAPTYAIRRLALRRCFLTTASLQSLVDAAWPLEELDVSENEFHGDAVGPALTALSQRHNLRRLDMGECMLSAASFKALVEATWPALTFLGAAAAQATFDGPDALGAAAFAGFPALEELDLSYVPMRAAGAALLGRRRWARLKKLDLCGARLDDAGVEALSRGAWPALEVLDVRPGGPQTGVTVDGVRRWAPALVELR